MGLRLGLRRGRRPAACPFLRCRLLAVTSAPRLPMRLPRSLLLLLPLLLFSPLIPPADVSSAAAAAPLISVEGTLQRLSGNRMPGPGTPAAATVAAGRRLVAIRGSLAAAGQPLWSGPLPPGRLLGSAVTDAQGRFRLSLPAGPVTLLIEVPGGYYLNSFDDRAQFSVVMVAPGLAPLRLVDDRGALH